MPAGLAETRLRLTWLQMDNQGTTISHCSARATHHMPHALSRAQFHRSGAGEHEVSCDANVMQ